VFQFQVAALHLGVCFSLFAADLLRFGAGFVWVLGLLLATWVVRGVLRLAGPGMLYPPCHRNAFKPLILELHGITDITCHVIKTHANLRSLIYMACCQP
jgi:hypothetical protein